MAQPKKRQIAKKRASRKAPAGKPQSISIEGCRIDSDVNVTFGEDFTDTYKDVARATTASAEAAAWAAMSPLELAKGLSSSRVTVNRGSVISINPNEGSNIDLSDTRVSGRDTDSRN